MRTLEAPDTAVPFLDLVEINAPFRAEFEAMFGAALTSGRFVGGEPVERFEQDFADYVERRHAVGVANGTDALELTLRGLGVGVGDEVIVPTNTFVATIEAIIAAGATPRLVDVDPGTLLLTPDIAMAATTARTAAIVVVHLFGQVADLGALSAVAQREGLALIEDAAQAHGARWLGAPVGQDSDAATFSFYPGKNLGALGDGGMVVTDDEALAAFVRSAANHGRTPDDANRHVVLGRNSRLDSIQASFLSLKLQRLDEHNARRRDAAQRYVELLGRDETVCLLDHDDRSTSVHHLFPVRVEDRDTVRSELQERGIATGIHYPVPCHRQPAYERLSPGVLPVAEDAASRLMSLPMSPTLTIENVERVCSELTNVTRGTTR